MSSRLRHPRAVLRSRRPLALASALVALSVPLSASRDTPVATQRTGFEQRAGASWTTLAEEDSYIAGVDAALGNVLVTRAGSSSQGRPLRLITVGPPRGRDEIAGAVTLLLVCTQHGNEPAGRESCLQHVRRFAATGSWTTLLVLPTANPDGVAADSRNNARDVDVNRDHETLATPEARAIKAVQEAYRPDVTMDLHEYSNLHRRNGERVEHGYNRNPAAREAIRDESFNLISDWVDPALRSAGFPTGAYATGAPTSFTTLNQTSGVRRSASALIESPREGVLSSLQRVRAHRTAIEAGHRMMVKRGDELAEATR